MNNYKTMVFSERWFEYARRYLNGEAKWKYIEAILNYGLYGNQLPDKFPWPSKEAFLNSEYEVELLNPDIKLKEQIGVGYTPLDETYKVPGDER